MLVVDGGTADYDIVRLIARGPKGSSSGGPGDGGPGSGPVGGGIKPVQVKGNGRRVRVPYRCPKATKPGVACNARLKVSLSRKGKIVTRSRTVRVRPGKQRIATLKVKRGFRHKVAKRGKVFVHARVRAKGHVYHVTRKVKVRHH